MGPPIVVRHVFELLPFQQCLSSADLIAVDGVSGAGKSTLAAQLSAMLDSRHIDLDQFLNEKRDSFVPNLRLADIEKLVVDSPGCRMVVSGICVLQVLEKLRMEPDIVIYVKSMSRHHGWRHEDEVAGEHQLHDVPMAREVREYHIRYRPHERADIVLERFTDVA